MRSDPGGLGDVQSSKTQRGRAVRVLMLQELFYVGCCLFIGAATAITNDLATGFKTALLCFAILQLVVIWVNREIIRVIWR